MIFTTAIILLLTSAALGIYMALGVRRLESITDEPLSAVRSCPRVSVIIPACNEADTIAPALRSVLDLDFPDLEVIVINDRAGGEYLLFTDADVIMESKLLSRSVHRMQHRRLDHLSLIFQPMVKGGLLNAAVLDGGQALMAMFRPWKAHLDDERFFMGVGAFNLVRTRVYREIHGHADFAMHPIDDLMPGKNQADFGAVSSRTFRTVAAKSFLTTGLYTKSLTPIRRAISSDIFRL